MALNNNDIEFLVCLEKTLSEIDGLNYLSIKLHDFNKRMIDDKNKVRERSKKLVSEKRKIDKSYGQKKKPVDIDLDKLFGESAETE